MAAKLLIGVPYASTGYAQRLNMPSIIPSQKLRLSALRSQAKRLDATFDFKYGAKSMQLTNIYTEIQDVGCLSEIIGKVAAGVIAKEVLELYFGTDIFAYISQVREVDTDDGCVSEIIGKVDAGSVAKKILKLYCGSDMEMKAPGRNYLPLAVELVEATVATELTELLMRQNVGAFDETKFTPPK